MNGCRFLLLLAAPICTLWLPECCRKSHIGSLSCKQLDSPVDQRFLHASTFLISQVRLIVFKYSFKDLLY